MIKHDIIQGTADWLELRWGKITGTASKGLFIKSDTLLIDLISQHIEDWELEDSYSSADMVRGTELEPYAREAISDELFISFKEIGFIQNAAIPILGLSPDGITEDDTIMLEIKCPRAKKHTETLLANEIPSDNIHQVLHYFTVNPKLETMYFVSYRPESKVKSLWYKALTKDSEIDLGTKAKPNVKTVAEWVEIAREEADKLNHELNMALLKLNEMYENN
jgi:hypothetical protein